jgi:hypothetical protein
MQSLFASGRIVDVILAVVALESVVLVLLRTWFGSGPGLVQLIPNLLAGVCLMVALRLALVGEPWPEIATALGAALVAHLADLASRWHHR